MRSGRMVNADSRTKNTEGDKESEEIMIEDLKAHSQRTKRESRCVMG